MPAGKTKTRVIAGTGLSLGASLVTGVSGAQAGSGGSTYEVDRTDDTVVIACSAAPNDCTLRGAIAIANATAVEDTITFASNVTGNTITLAVGGGEFSVTRPLSIDGPGAGALTISANSTSQSRIFAVNMLTEGDDFEISGLTLTGGNAVVGGAIYNIDSDLRLFDCTLTGNTATAHGGAIYDTGGGGAEGYGNDIVRTAIVGNNAGSYGGGVAGAESAGYFFNSTISGNTAGSYGGGVWSDKNSYLVESTVSNNMAADGGGVTSLNEYMVLTSTILANNTATGTGPDAEGGVIADFSLIEDTTGFDFGTGSADNILGPDPQLGGLALNGGTTLNRLPAATSPVVDKGITGENEDQRGRDPTDRHPDHANAAGGDGSDIGAVELTLAEAGFVPPGGTQPTPPATLPKKKKKCKKKKKGAAAAKKCKKKKK